MPRYHFSSTNGSRAPDEEGMELPDDQAAHAHAMIFPGEVLKSEPQLAWEHGQWRVEVTDDDDVLLFTVIVLAVDAPRPRRHPRA